MKKVFFNVVKFFIKASSTVEHRLTTTLLLWPYSFKPTVKIIESFYYLEDPVNGTTSLLRPGFYGPMVVALTGFHCITNVSVSQLKLDRRLS